MTSWFTPLLFSFIMKSIKGTETEKNLLKSFSGESQARNRYTFFASAAKKEGYEQIASIFEETANQEKEHAKRFFKFLEGGCVEITASFPAGIIGSTEQNLISAAEGENEEWEELYPHFAQVAREEGFPEIAEVFEKIATVEYHHEQRYRQLLHNVQTGTVFQKGDLVVSWQCRNCGFVTEGSSAPELCPACAHPQAFFEVQKHNW